MQVPSWVQLWRRAVVLWRSRRTAFTMCAECRFPFVLNGSGRDTANLELAVIHTDGTARCGECGPPWRKLQEKIEAKKAKRRARVDFKAAIAGYDELRAVETEYLTGVASVPGGVFTIRHALLTAVAALSEGNPFADAVRRPDRLGPQ